MKKGLTIFLLLIYSLSVYGIVFKEIYCCGKLKTVTLSLTVNENHKCCHEHNGCSKTKYHYFKAQDNHFGATVTPTSIQPFTQIHFDASTLSQLALYSFHQKALVNSSHAPPWRSSVPVYIYNCIYRI